MESLLESIKYTLPSLVVFAAAYFAIKSSLKAHFTNEQKMALLGIKNAEKNATIPIRLQAYERLALFLERITPMSLMHRARQPKMTVRTFHLSLLTNIRQEFEHNVSQQVYVSELSWNSLKKAKEHTINIINHAAKDLNPDADAMELSRAIIEYTGKQGQELPTDLALTVINSEAAKLYHY